MSARQELQVLRLSRTSIRAQSQVSWREYIATSDGHEQGCGRDFLDKLLWFVGSEELNSSHRGKHRAHNMCSILIRGPYVLIVTLFFQFDFFSQAEKNS